MRSIRLKTPDLAEATGYTRYQMRGFLAEVFPGNSIGKKVGAQRTYSRQDLQVVAVACEIEREYGVERKKLALVAGVLGRALNGPRVADTDRSARLLVTFNPPAATYIASEAPLAEGLLVRLGPVFVRVDEYMGVSGSRDEAAQPPLPLRPALATGRREGSRRR